MTSVKGESWSIPSSITAFLHHTKPRQRETLCLWKRPFKTLVFSRSCLERLWVYRHKNHHPDEAELTSFSPCNILYHLFSCSVSNIYIRLMNLDVYREVSSQNHFPPFSVTPKCCVIASALSMLAGYAVILASSAWRLCSLGQYCLRVTSVPHGDVTWLVKVLVDVSNKMVEPLASLKSSAYCSWHMGC